MENRDDMGQDEGLRTGGDVQTKGASSSAPSGTEPATRTGGDVQTKGASREEDDDQPSQPK